MELIRTFFESYAKPVAMTIFGPTLMGFGTLNATGSWETAFKIGSAFFGFLTAFGGFVITILGIIWWARRLSRQNNKNEEEEES